MKNWKECPDCWGTGLVGGFNRRCDRERMDEYEYFEGIALDIETRDPHESISPAQALRELQEMHGLVPKLTGEAREHKCTPTCEPKTCKEKFDNCGPSYSIERWHNPQAEDRAHRIGSSRGPVPRYSIERAAEKNAELARAYGMGPKKFMDCIAQLRDESKLEAELNAARTVPGVFRALVGSVVRSAIADMLERYAR